LHRWKQVIAFLFLVLLMPMINTMKHLFIPVFLLLILFINPLFAQKDFQAYEEGLAKFKAKEYAAVIDNFTAILNNPDHSKKLEEDLYYYRGQSYYYQNEFKSAMADLDQSLTLNHYNKAIIYWYKARCSDKLNNKAEAVKNYDEALTLAGTNKKVSAQILADRAQFNAREGNKEAADQDLAKAIALDPNNPALANTDVSPKTIANRTAGGEEKKTQLIVQSNQKASENTAKNKAQVTDNPPVQNETVKSTLIPAIAETYKDEKRYALVIGNSNYSKEIGILKNPVNDATDVATELRNSNFEVQLLTNATYIQIREAMRRFQEKLTEGPRDQTVGLFYYAGHGVQYQDENYLVPVDANVQYEDDIARMCFPVQRMILANMERSNSRMNIVILDACRNNPFPATSRSLGSGLGEMKRARGSFIAFATAPGSVASDGNGRNGLYTQELLKALRKPGLTIEQVFKDVRMNVLRLSGDRQYTWDSSNIIGEFVFKF
jgi:tetratricopeptide (TPR) repeat protein